MAPKKKVTGLIKLQIVAGQANPAPPVGPALGQHGVNIMEFCKAYNAATEAQRGTVIPVEITVYEDRSQTSTPMMLMQQCSSSKARHARWVSPSRNSDTVTTRHFGGVSGRATAARTTNCIKEQK